MHLERLQLEDPNVWRTGLGLLPVPLFSNAVTPDSFVLFNGTRGNFCLDIRGAGTPPEARDFAWSSDVGHYVSVGEEYVDIQAWDSQSSSERYRRETVAADIQRFYSYLEKRQPRREFSIVAHLMRVFRSLRSSLGPSVHGQDSLGAFLYLIACATDSVNRGRLGLGEWALRKQAEELATSIPADHWDARYEETRSERGFLRVRPHFPLTLHHAAGQTFQEAHYEAVFLNQEQLSLRGFTPTPVPVIPRSNNPGIHFTPPALARTLVEESFRLFDSKRKLSVSVFDPACGSGEFLREALRQLSFSGYQGHIEIIGWDLSPAACDMARFILAWEGRQLAARLSVNIRNVDSLSLEQWPKCDVLLMNPPFVSWQDLGSEQKSHVSATLGRLAKYRPDLSSAFIWKAAHSLQSGSIIGTIIPASFLDSNSSSTVRNELSGILTPHLIGRLGSHLLFSSAIVDAGLYLATKDVPSTASPIAFWANHELDSTSAGLRALRRIRAISPKMFPAIDEEQFSIYQNSTLGSNEASWAPRPFASWRLLETLHHLPTVGNLFAVHQGARTGANPVFVLGKATVYAWPKREQRYFRPAVLNESIRDGVLIDSAYVFYPYGEFGIDTEDQLKKVVPSYYAQFLKPNKPDLSARAGFSKRWWHLDRPRDYQFTRRKLVSTYFGDVGSFAWDDQGYFVVVQGWAWIPKLNKKSSELPTQTGLAYLALLNSRLFSKLLGGTSNHVGGGQWNLSKKFVDLIPIPNLSNKEISGDLIGELAAIGRKIRDGKGFEEPRFESVVSSAYGLSDLH